MANCLQCNKEYKPLRVDSKYCSPQCRKLAFRAKQISVPEDANLSVPEISVPDEQRIGKVIKGYCHGCGKEVKSYICICLDCFNKGKTHKSLDIAECDY